MKNWRTALAILAALSASIALADDFKTIDGREYKNVTVTRVDPDGINVKNTKAGVIAKLYLTELPKEVQQRYGYDPEKAAAYSAKQNAALEQARKQQEEAMRQRAEATARQNQYLAGKNQPERLQEAKKFRLQKANRIKFRRRKHCKLVTKNFSNKRTRYYSKSGRPNGGLAVIHLGRNSRICEVI